MLEGMKVRIELTARFEKATTKITATHIVSVVSSFVVTAKAEQIPKTWSAMGLFLTTGSNKTSVVLTFAIFIPEAH
jgi:hypothetical protein